MDLSTLNFYLTRETYGPMKEKLWNIKTYLNKFEYTVIYWLPLLTVKTEV